MKLEDIKDYIDASIERFMTWFMCPYRKEGRKLWSNKGLVALYYIISAICAVNIGIALTVILK